MIALDIEVYKNYFLAVFKNIDNNNVKIIEVKGENSLPSPTDLKTVYLLLNQRETFGFNSLNYDIPILLYFLTNKTCKELYKLSKWIIESDTMPWDVYNQFDLCDKFIKRHIDIRKPASNVGGLKMLVSRLHFSKIKELPYDPHSTLNTEQMNNIKRYCINDVDATIYLYNHIKQELTLRENLEKEYKVDVISKANPAVAETLMLKLLPTKLYKQTNLHRKFKYKIPTFLQFEHLQLFEIIENLKKHTFETDKDYKITLPNFLTKEEIKIGETYYKMGIGGLHSTEKSQVVHATENTYIIDKDVASYYPNIIIKQNLFPKQAGFDFVLKYHMLVLKRLKAKKEGDKVTADSLKIVVNSIFGKFGNKWSRFYDPECLINVTLTGQLALLLAIEKLESAGIKVISANTDGFVSVVPKHKYEEYEEICKSWERITQLDLENNFYKSLYSIDVNNYIAIHKDGTHKAKGIFAKTTLMKNPAGYISKLAVIERLKNGTDIKETISKCKDLSMFVICRKVTGGAVWKGKEIGSIVRWVHSKNGEQISYLENGNKVSLSEQALVVQNFPEIFPKCLDYDRYVQDAQEILDKFDARKDD